MSRRRLFCGALGAALLLASGGTFLAASAGAAESPPAATRSLVAGASAQGMRMGYSVPDTFAVSQFIDGGGPVAQVRVEAQERRSDSDRCRTRERTRWLPPVS